jgi:hypothetical protein
MMEAAGMRASSMAVEGGNDGDDFDGVAGLDGSGGGELEREDLVDGEVLRGEDAVEAFEGEGAFAIKEVGDVRLLEPCLPGDTAASEEAAFDATLELGAKKFV